MGMKTPITQAELKRRLLECGGISPDDAENAAVLELFDKFEEMERDRDGWRRNRDMYYKRCEAMGKVVEAARGVIPVAAAMQPCDQKLVDALAALDEEKDGEE